MTEIIINGGAPLDGCPDSWDDATAWEKSANKEKENDFFEPNWKFDCGFKLDFDGGLVRISSRFYPPKQTYGENWDGNLSVMIGNKKVKTYEFECSDLEELKVKVEEKYKEILSSVENIFLSKQISE